MDTIKGFKGQITSPQGYIITIHQRKPNEKTMQGRTKTAEPRTKSPIRKSNTIEQIVKSCKNRSEIWEEKNIVFANIERHTPGAFESGHPNFGGKNIFKNP